MPKFELTNWGDQQDISLKITDGDLRINDYHILERWQSNVWVNIGNIEELLRDCTSMKTQIINFESWMYEQKIKDDELQVLAELENEYDNLKGIGQHLRQLEKMLLVARKSYKAMSAECIAMQKTFERLDQPYPEKVDVTT